jgi:hypothetical protein
MSNENDVEALAKVIRDAGISGVKGDHVGPFDLARADAVLASDWLAAHVSAAETKARADERERIELLVCDCTTDFLAQFGQHHADCPVASIARGDTSC